MPPKQRITKEMILDRAFEMFCREGMGMVNARSVAKALNCSTQPIFSYYTSMDELKTNIEQRAKTLFADVLAAAVCEDDPVVSMGRAYIHFAVEYPRLFKHLFMLDGEDAIDPLGNDIQQERMLKREAVLTGLSKEAVSRLAIQMLVYVQGLAMVCTAGKASFTVEEMDKMIADMHKILIANASC